MIRKVTCRECGKTVALRHDYTLWHHKDDSYANGTCLGTGSVDTPIDRVETSQGTLTRNTDGTWDGPDTGSITVRKAIAGLVASVIVAIAILTTGPQCEDQWVATGWYPDGTRVYVCTDDVVQATERS